jgi:hypothetical protein
VGEATDLGILVSRPTVSAAQLQRKKPTELGQMIAIANQ